MPKRTWRAMKKVGSSLGLRTADIALMVLFAIIALVIPFTSRFGRGGGQAVVKVDGEAYMTLSLGTDGEYPIDTAYGHNSVVIEGGQARMSEADCPDGHCLNYVAIGADGGLIVCLPHRLTVEIIGSEEGVVDAVAE